MKKYHIKYNIGKVKYLVSYHNGEKHNDKSDFYNIKIFKNKKQLSMFENELISSGYQLSNY